MKFIYLVLTFVYLNATSFGIAQIEFLQASFPVLLIAIFAVAFPAALFWRPILFKRPSL